MGQVTSTINVNGNAVAQLDAIYHAINRVNTGFSNLVNQSGAISGALDVVNRAISGMSTRTNNLNNRMNALPTSIQRARDELSDLGNTADRVTSQMLLIPRRINPQIGTLGRRVGSVGTYAAHSAGQVDLLTSKLRRLASIYLGVMGSKAVIGTADTITSAESRLTTVATQQYGMSDAGAQQFSSVTMDKIFNAAQSSASSYTEMMGNVSKSITLAGKAFGKTSEQQVDNAIKFQEIMAKSYALGGASAAEQASSMYQMVQALGSGVLQGDELRSVREGAPLAYQAIEKFAQGVLDTDKSLKDMASQGLITSNMVVAAILDMEGETAEAFDKLDLTFAQMWEKFKNNAVYAFQPFLRKLREVSNSDAFQFLIEKITGALQDLANIAEIVLNDINNALTWMKDNWDLVEAGIKGAAAAMAVLIAYNLGATVVHVWQLATAFMTAHPAITAITASVAILVAYFSYFGATCESVGNLLWYIGVALLAIAAYAAITNTALLGLSAPVWFWIAVVVFAVSMFLMFTEEIVGAAYVVWAVLQNICAAIVQMVGGYIVYFLGLIDNLVNFLSNCIDAPITSWVRAFESGINTILGFIQNLAKAIDHVFGSNLAGAVGNWMSAVSNKADELVEKYAADETYTVKSNLAGQLQEKLDGFTAQVASQGTYGDAWNKGTAKGAQISDSINGFFSNIGDMFSFGGDGIKYPEPEATADPISETDILEQISANTGKTARNTETTEEDMRFLRQIAERRAINRFTTATIKVDMTNNNTLSNIDDMDGFVTHLGTRLREELAVVAHDVHVS